MLLLLALALPLSEAKSQKTDTIVSQLLVEYDKGNYSNVLSLFETLAEKDPYNAEVFYWLRAAENESLKPKVLVTLAKCYHKCNNAPKTIAMYKELATKANPSIPMLQDAAKVVINLGDVKVTQLIYQKILEKDPKNAAANLFLGNFIYLRVQKELSRLEYNFNQKKKHTRMEYAEYRKAKKSLYDNYFTQAEKYLRIAQKQRKSAEVSKTLQKIKDLEQELK